MASRQSNVDFVLEQMADAGPVSARKMFGEYAIYRGHKIIALFCDDQLFVKPTNAGRAFIGEVQEAPPYPGAKPWFSIGGDSCEDSEWLSELVRSTAAELPEPKTKAARKNSTKVVAKSKPRQMPKTVVSPKQRSSNSASAIAKPKAKAKRGKQAAPVEPSERSAPARLRTRTKT